MGCRGPSRVTGSEAPFITTGNTTLPLFFRTDTSSNGSPVRGHFCVNLSVKDSPLPPRPWYDTEPTNHQRPHSHDGTLPRLRDNPPLAADAERGPPPSRHNNGSQPLCRQVVALDVCSSHWDHRKSMTTTRQWISYSTRQTCRSRRHYGGRTSHGPSP